MTAAPKQGMVSHRGARMTRMVPPTRRSVTRGIILAISPSSSTQMAMFASPAHRNWSCKQHWGQTWWL